VKTNIFSSFCFLGFVALGLLLVLWGRFLPAMPRRRLTNFFLLVVLFISFGAGLTQHDFWPFSSWPVLAFAWPADGNHPPFPRIMAVDAGGREYDIDYRAWRPLALEELLSWIHLHLAQLDPASQNRVGAYLLGQSNLAREQALSSAGLPYPNRWFGPLTAPTHMMHPAIWSHPESVPRNPFVELRFYEEAWNLEERRHDPEKVTLVLIFDYRP
jgi:hypothetical protein